MLADMSWAPAEGAAGALLPAGFIALAVAVASGNTEAIRAAGVVLALGALAFGCALGVVLAHLARRVPSRAASRLAEVGR